MHVDIFSDPICPWCFIGKRRLERALNGRPRLKPIIRWRAFQLNPAMPPGGMDRQTYLATKFGSVHEAQRLYGHIAQVGLTEGIEFRFDKIEVTPSTVQAHRMVRLAGQLGRADDLVEAMFRAYFIDGRNIGDPAILASLAVEIGLERKFVVDYLAGDEDANAVRNEDMHGRQLGIEGVPYVIVDDRYALSGAQEPEAFFSLFDAVTEEFRATAQAGQAD